MPSHSAAVSRCSTAGSTTSRPRYGHICWRMCSSNEITHVLQGMTRHSETGIMKAHWDDRDLRKISSKAFDRVFEVLDLAPLIAEKPDAVVVGRGPVAVEFDHVDFSYPTAEEVSLASLESVAVLDQTPSSQVLYDVSFRAEPGQLVALVGPSGAGKTTISYLVSRLYDARSGAVRLNGIDVRDATFASLRESIGVVTQDAHLFHETIRANLLYAKPDATEEELHEAVSGAQILPFVESLPDGLDTVV